MSGTKTAGPPSDLMAPVLLLLVLLAEAASTSDLVEVKLHPGDDVILPCEAADSFIRVVKWTRPDLQPDTILYYSDGQLETDEQNSDFSDRVELVDRDLKDGNVSVILKNVDINDAGIYTCRVKTGELQRSKRDIHSDPIRTIRTVRLVPGSEDGPSSHGGLHLGLVAGVVVGLVLVAAGAAVAGVLMYKRQKRPGKHDAAYKPAEMTP